MSMNQPPIAGLYRRRYYFLDVCWRRRLAAFFWDDTNGEEFDI